MSGRRDLAISFIPALFGTTALTLSLIATIGCETIKINPEANDLPVLSFGVWYYHSWEYVETSDSQIVVRNTCVKYPGDVDMDAKWKTAMAFSIITPVIGGLVVIWNWMAPCMNSGAKFWKKAGVVYILCSLFQGLTLLLLSSNACNDNPAVSGLLSDLLYTDECELDWGIKCSISAVVFWFVAGASMMRGLKRAEPASDQPEITEEGTSDAVKEPQEEEEHVVKEEEQAVEETTAVKEGA